MSIIQWNIRGFNAHREQVKVLFKNHDVSAFCIQETKLGNCSIKFGLNYAFYRSLLL